MEKNKVRVIINGSEYTLVTSEPAEYVQTVAIRVDRKLKEIKKEAPQLTNSMAALLTAINLSDEYIKLEDATDNLRKQVAEYAKNEAKLVAALDERNSKVNELEKTVQELKIEIARRDGNHNSGYRKY